MKTTRLEQLSNARRNQKTADALEQEKSKFIGAAAHDLRNPLAALKGYLGILLENTADTLTAEQNLLLNQADRATDALFALLRDMEDISALENKNFSLSIDAAPVTPFLFDCVQTMEPQAEAKDITLALVRPETSFKVRFDSVQMKHAVVELIKNAIKFSASGTEIIVTAFRKDEMLCFSVTDQGQGIPAVEVPSLFADFARISVRPTGNDHTTRLGLGIVRRIVEAHGGTTLVATEVLKGSTFTIQIPWKDETVA
jgi:hypothetical protein